MIEAFEILRWTIPVSLGLVFVLFIASAQYAHGIAWCAGIFFFWAFVNGLMLGEIEKAHGNAKAIRTARIADLWFQSTVQATLFGFALMLSRDVKKRLFYSRCAKCGNRNVKTVTNRGGS